MKKTTRLAVEIVMTAVCVLSWVWLVVGTRTSMQDFRQAVHAADALYERKLYKLAADSYRTALGMQESEDLYSRLLQTLRAWYDEELTNVARNSLLRGYEDATGAYPSAESWWEEYAQIYLDAGSTASAVQVLRRAMEAGASGETIRRQWNESYYATVVGGGQYESISPYGVGEQFVVCRNGQWGTITVSGGEAVPAQYLWAGPAGESGLVLFGNEDGECLLLDRSGTMRGRFTASIEESLGYGAGGIPARLAGRTDWCYLSQFGDEIFSGFEAAGRFQEALAPVRTGGVWRLIGPDGADTGAGAWEDIRLDETGGWLAGGRMLAKRDGVWNLWDTSGHQVGNLSAEDVDVGRGGWIAFQRNGLWGYVDTEGNQVLEPSYAAAKSFSGGVGAVSNGTLWGFLNSRGELVVAYQYAEVGYFNAVCAPVRLEAEGAWHLLRWRVART